MLLGIKWHQFVRNDQVQRLTGQPKLTAIVQSRRLTLFEHIACTDDSTDAKRVLSLSLQRTGGDLEDAPASHDSAPYSRI